MSTSRIILGALVVAGCGMSSDQISINDQGKVSECMVSWNRFVARHKVYSKDELIGGGSARVGDHGGKCAIAVTRRWTVDRSKLEVDLWIVSDDAWSRYNTKALGENPPKDNAIVKAGGKVSPASMQNTCPVLAGGHVSSLRALHCCPTLLSLRLDSLRSGLH